LSVAGFQKPAFKISFLSQNPGVQSEWHSNHCFSTIQVHLAHPQNDFGWLGRGSMGSKSPIRLVFVSCWISKTSFQNILFEPESRFPISMALKPLLLNHPSSPDTSIKWFWMLGRGSLQIDEVLW
jgi:hypothetical protein